MHNFTVKGFPYRTCYYDWKLVSQLKSVFVDLPRDPIQQKEKPHYRYIH